MIYFLRKAFTRNIELKGIEHDYSIRKKSFYGTPRVEDYKAVMHENAIGFGVTLSGIFLKSTKDAKNVIFGRNKIPI